MNKINYRSDIDGLRAVAVLSVILYHINPGWVPGGFLGVDIFFVISGYLITSLLSKDISKTHKFHIMEFYERRIKRIIPALLFVLFFSFFAGIYILSPSDLLLFLKSIIWALFSAANIFFYSSIDTGYFATGSDELPLLHLWSLGVEEQFYILWPFLVLLLIKYITSTRIQILIISVLLISSFVWAQSIQETNHSFAYYMLPTRAWELLAGSVAAFFIQKRYKLNKIFDEILASIGALLIIFGFIFITSNDPVPGIGAMPTIIGATFIILSGANKMTYVGRILSIKIVVLIGLISYSAYLWHWPILAFLRYGLVKIDLTIGLIVLLITLIMATISYILIETPLRKNKISRKFIFIGYFLIPTIILTTTSFYVIKAIEDKDSWVYPWEKLTEVESSTIPANKYKYNCQFFKFNVQAYNQERCVYPRKNTPSVFLIGDSNAAHYLGMIRVFADYYGFTIRNATQSACPLLLNGEYNWISKKYKNGCTIYRSSIYEQAIKYDTIIVGGSWNSYDNKEFKENFSKTIEQLSQGVKNVIILSKIPFMPNYSKDCANRAIHIPWIDCSTHFKNKNNDIKINNFIKKLSKKYNNVDFFDIRDQICNKDQCSPYIGNTPLYYNSGHLSMAGSTFIGKLMLKNNSPILKVFENINIDNNRIRFNNYTEYQNIYKKEKTSIKIIENKRNITFRVIPTRSDVKIAMYLYRNDVRVDVQWYSKNFEYKLNKMNYDTGHYKIRYFIVDESVTNPGKTTSKKETGVSKSIKI